jgi:hypothetical protein
MVARDPAHRVPPDERVAAEPRAAIVRFALWAGAHELLPQAWLAGLLETYNTTRLWPCYLMGEYSRTGWWSYYPLTFLFKTPLATLAAIALAGAAGASRVVNRVRRRAPQNGWIDRGALICLLTPLVIYSLAAITSRLDQGVRHIFPVYPFSYVLVALVVARLRWRKFILPLLAIGLGVETVAAHPNYIAFFNGLARPHRLHLLADSNLDWGQDLKLLAKWRRDHPGGRLYVSYFGMADPDYYLGQDYTPLPGTTSTLREAEYPRETGVLAISATSLQGVYVDERARRWYRALAERGSPIDVLGGTIYLYRFQ